MIIVYAAVAGQSVVKLYAAAMFPVTLVAFLYLVYIIGWALLNPKIAPKLPESETRVPVRPWVRQLQQTYSRKMLPALVAAVVAPARALNMKIDDMRPGYGMLLRNLGFALVPLVLTLVTLWGAWWYVVIFISSRSRNRLSRWSACKPPARRRPPVPNQRKRSSRNSADQSSNPTRPQKRAGSRKPCSKWAVPNCASRSWPRLP